MIEIKKVYGGWVEIQFDNLTISGSYLSDIPMEWLTTIKFALTEQLPWCLHIDNEYSKNMIVGFQQEVFYYESDKMFYKIFTDSQHFLIKLFSEMTKYKNEWYNWVHDIDYYSQLQKDNRKKKLDELFNDINAILTKGL